MATRAKTPPSKADKNKKSASKTKPAEKAVSRSKSVKPATKSAPVKPAKAKSPIPSKSKTAERKVQELAKVEATAEAIAKKPAKVAHATEPEEKKPAKRGKEMPAPMSEEKVLHAEESSPARGRKKVAKEIDEDEDDLDLDQDDDEIDDEDRDDEDDEDRSTRGRRKEAGKKGVRSRKRSATEEFLEEDMGEVEEVDDVEILDDLDPFSSALILDPELAGPPPAPQAQLPPRPKRLAPRLQKCADCGQQYGWLSIEKVCFNCLKRRVAQRKKDEDYSGYGGSDDSGGDDDY